MYQSLAQPRYGERMMYDGAPIMGDYGLLGSDMAAPATAPVAAPTGFQFMTDRGRKAGYGTNKSGFIAADPNAQYRMFDERGKNKVVAEGTGVDALQNIYTLANQFNKEQGKKANWGIERLNPETGKWERVAENDPAKNVIGKIADVALPIAASFIPGVGPVLGAALGSAASSVAQGRSLENTLLRAGLSAGTAGLVGATGIDKAVGGVLGDVGGALAGKTAEEVAKQTTGDIVVTGLSKALQAAGSAIGQTALSEVGKAGLSEITGYQTPAEQFAQQPLPEGLLPPVDMYPGIDPINVLANRATATAPNYGSVLSGVFEPIATEFLPKSVLPEPLPSEPAIADETIVVTAPQSVAAPPPIPGFETAIPATIGGALTAAQTAGTPPSGKDGVLGTGLTLPQLLSIGGIGADLLQNLLAGGGGTGTATPYVSPFGTGAGFAPRQDMRANPNIMDYERYGFGPEAMFFQPQYTGLLPGNALPPPQAEPAMTINPALMPLI
jgi:hypothetical protein